ncbi:hypothetical protein HKCCSP123_07675 [Rhodobacterales bacterium HKCCSP123]|nr:hypothetical protein [Rhodobacterales bacterium HKCCSP123]
MSKQIQDPCADAELPEMQSGDGQPAKSRKPPKIVFTEESGVTITLDSQEQLQELYGTRTYAAASAILSSALNSLGENAASYLDLMPAMAVEMEPRDAVEAMLVTQMAATHVAMTTMSLKLHHTTSLQARESFERSMTRLSRTFLAQMDQLKKYRAKAQQVVRVERVEVNEGGQAIVGDVSYRRGEGRNEK